MKEYARQNEEWAFLLEVPAVIYQQALKDLDKAYQGFYRGGGYPKFMSKGKKESFRFPNPKDIHHDAEHPNQIRLPKIGWVHLRNCWTKLGEGKLYEGELKNTTIKHETDGWYVIFNCEVKRAEPKAYLPGVRVGIDLGIAQSFTMSTPDSEPLHVPVITKKEFKHLQRVQSEISRKQAGSNNQKKQRAYLNSLFKRYTNRKQDYLHKITTQLTRTNQHEIIVLEDLRVMNMTASASGIVEEPGTNVAQKAGLNRTILNQSWGLTRRLLEYKSQEYGNQLVLVNPAYTSQECSSCGYSHEDNRPEQAVFDCFKCGLSMNADVNAAHNILNRGLDQLKTDDLYSKKARAEFKREQRVIREQERLTNTLEEALNQKAISKTTEKTTKTTRITTKKPTNKNTNITAAGIVAREEQSSMAYPMLGRLPGDNKAHSGIILSEETSKKTVTNTNQTRASNNTTPNKRSQQTHTNPPNG